MKTKSKIILTILIIVVIVLAVRNIASMNDNYIAVFLSNNQVYFGVQTGSSGDFIHLEKVYYIQITKPLEAPAAENLQLIRLGTELHGPENKMSINRNHIIFTEPLRSDSKVVASILEAEKDLGGETIN